MKTAFYFLACCYLLQYFEFNNVWAWALIVCATIIELIISANRTKGA